MTEPRPDLPDGAGLDGTDTGAATPDLPSVLHDYPAAVLLMDLTSDHVTFANDLAHQLTPDLVLPVTAQEWSAVAGLEVVGGGGLGASSTPLSQIALGNPRGGREVSAELESQASTAREALWVIGLPFEAAPEPLRRRAVLVLLPLRFPAAIADLQLAAASGAAHQTVLSSDLGIAITDPTGTTVSGGPVEENPLVWVNAGFERVTGYSREEVVGRNCRFLQGPATDPVVVARIRENLAAEEAVSETLLNYRKDGTAYYNHLSISPVRDDRGQVVHHVSIQTDVTQRVLAQQDHEETVRRVAEARAAQARAEREGSHGRVLLTLSQALTATSSVDDVATTVHEVTASELGTSGSGLLLPDRSGTRLVVTATAHLPAGSGARWRSVGLDDDVSTAVAARSRTPVFFRDRAELLAASPRLDGNAVPAMGASAYLPLVLGADLVGVLALAWGGPHDLDTDERGVLQALAGYTAQAVQRALLLAERRSAARILQESLLTRLPEPDTLELRARYVPASSGEQVGGDWYDAVVLPDGATTVVIGDVTGHDIVAAAHMGQLRGLLRAYAYDRLDPPSAIVARTDRAQSALGIDGLATLVLGRIDRAADGADHGRRSFRWTNAGHPPPLLLHADGRTEVLDSEPDTLVGLLPDTARNDHTAMLPSGSTLLLYTDGLIEHRGRSLSEGITDLRRCLTRHHDLPLRELLDWIVVELIGESPDDDCAVLGVRAHPQNAPRPPEAGTAQRT